jgi:hypothetical protein
MAIQAWIADGVARATEELVETHAVDTDADVLESHCCALGDFGSSEFPLADDDLVAGVMMSFRGVLSGAALLVMDPEDALGWATADGNKTDPIAAYVQLSEHLLKSVVESASDALEAEMELGPARLEESSIAGCLLRTHAPSDTVLISSRLDIEAGHQRRSARIFLMMDGKVVSTLLGALSVSIH